MQRKPASSTASSQSSFLSLVSQLRHQKSLEIPEVITAVLEPAPVESSSTTNTSETADPGIVSCPNHLKIANFTTTYFLQTILMTPNEQNVVNAMVVATTYPINTNNFLLYYIPFLGVGILGHVC